MSGHQDYDHHHKGHKGGHVSLKLYRGPNEGHHDYKKGGFAPWGYYAKLPEDESGHYGYHWYISRAETSLPLSIWIWIWMLEASLQRGMNENDQPEKRFFINKRDDKSSV